MVLVMEVGGLPTYPQLAVSTGLGRGHVSSVPVPTPCLSHTDSRVFHGKVEPGLPLFKGPHILMLWGVCQSDCVSAFQHILFSQQEDGARMVS